MQRQHYPVATASDDDDGIFDRCARGLETSGYALLSLSALPRREGGVSTTDAAVVARAFDSARRALDAVPPSRDRAASGPSPPLVDPSTDSGGWTGYHDAGVIHGRYNRCREGFVFSNGEMFDAAMIGSVRVDGGGRGGGGGASNDFRDDMDRLFRAMHDVADGVLRAIERRLDMPNSYFRRELGPTDESSQWHVKRYVVDPVRERDGSSSNSDDAIAVEGRDNDRGENDVAVPVVGKSGTKEAEILLPVHTDPSLISVVILDRAGTNEGGMGLEVFHPDSSARNVDSGGGGSWREISHHGHEVAVIFVGSVLSYLTKGRIYSAARHRVVNRTSSSCRGVREDDRVGAERMAATLFVRPSGDAVMKMLPSRHLQFDDGAMDDMKDKSRPTFRVWNARVSKHYMSKRNKK
jgi:isopenicillin N synthase-like dioxygenase